MIVRLPPQVATLIIAVLTLLQAGLIELPAIIDLTAK